MNEKKPKLLIVDDDIDLVTVLAFLFEGENFIVHTASGGNEAFDFIQSHEVDVVLSDIRMPNGSGVDLIHRIRKQHKRRPLVFMMTGYADVKTEDIYDFGAEGLFAKPFDPAELLNAIHKAINPPEKRWPACEKVSAQFCVAASSSDIALGRGGMFIPIARDFPAVDQMVSFRIYNASDNSTLIMGMGTTRWVRQQVTPELPSGAGIEWECFEDATRDFALKLIREMDCTSFIPNTPNKKLKTLEPLPPLKERLA